jgi:hypothetical protein
MFGIRKAVDIPGEGTGETDDSLSEVDGVGEEWCLRGCDRIVLLAVSIFSEEGESWYAIGFGGDTAGVGACVF